MHGRIIPVINCQFPAYPPLFWAMVWELKGTVLPNGQPLTVAFSVLVRMCGPKAKKAEKAPLLIKKGREKHLGILKRVFNTGSFSDL